MFSLTKNKPITEMIFQDGINRKTRITATTIWPPPRPFPQQQSNHVNSISSIVGYRGFYFNKLKFKNNYELK